MDQYQRRNEVVREAVSLCIDHLLDTEFPDRDPQALAAALSCSEFEARRDFLEKNSYVMTTDLAKLCDALGVDFAITLRKPDGTEVTFYPGRNFGVGNQAQPRRYAQKEVGGCIEIIPGD